MNSNDEVLVVGIDAALANMGFIKVAVDPKTLKVKRVVALLVAQTEPGEDEVAHVNHDRLRRARDLLQEMRAFCYGARIACAEVPEGSKSANAAWALGLATGLLAACSLPMVEVRPVEVKKASTGSKTASKDDIINWAVGLFPDAPWMKQGGRVLKKNEHAADALAAIYAALQKPKFVNFVSSHPVQSERRRLQA